VKRIATPSRNGWEEIIASQGMSYNETDLPDGSKGSYWNENHAYVLTMHEVESLEEQTEQLHKMSLEAASFLSSEQYKRNSPFARMGVSAEALEYATFSLDRNDPFLYGRFDLAYSGREGEPAKFLEYNADTPTGLVEASIVQWYWKEHLFPELDQWNGLHEALVERFEELKVIRGWAGQMHFAFSQDEPTGEDMVTTGYLLDCAEQAGWESPRLIDMSEIWYNHPTKSFVNTDEQKIGNLFKLYPWEDMVGEHFGKYLVETRPDGWLQPAWTMFLSTKMLAAALWHIYPGHPNLVPAYPDEPRSMKQWVKKPLHGREGDGITICLDDGELISSKTNEWGEEGYVYQEYCELPLYTGDKGEPNYPVLGSWIIGDEAYGVGIRESDGPITDVDCRFVPNLIDG
jgi:glutathionylspermidine synthase